MLGLLIALLAGCAEASVTALPTPAPTIAPTQTVAPAPIQPTSPAAPTATAILTSPTPTAAPPLTPPALPAPTATRPPSPTTTPFVPTHRQIGPPGCCQAFAFAEDGRLYFYDKPANESRPATFTYNPANDQRQPLTTRFGTFSRDLSLVAVSDRGGNVTTVEQVSDGTRRATLQNRATQTFISPDKAKVAYLLRLPNQAAEAPQRFELWVGNSDGSNLRIAWSLVEGANLSWFPDNRRLLLTARDTANQRFGLWVVDSAAPASQAATLIVESKGLIEATLSSDGARVGYAITLQGENNSGIWLANADGSQRRKFDWLGGWRWSPTNPNELFYIPTRKAGDKANSLWVYDAATAQATNLVSPAALSFQIALDEWEIAPDNKTLAYRSATDNALWLLRFRG